MKNPLQHLFQAVSNAMAPSPLQVEITPEWLQPVDSAAPSGPALEYDPEYAVLAARLTPKAEVQYGQFKATAPEPDWKEIERDCRRLLLRSKDLNLLVWFTRSRTRQAGAQGLLQGLSALQQVCARFGESVHPQLQIDGEFDPVVRANTLAALCDPEGLLGDVREVVIAAASAQRLTVRDVERALGLPRPAYAMDPEAVQRQLTDLFQRRDPQLLALQACAVCVQYLQQWAEEQLRDEAPQLSPLIKLLQPLLGSAAAVLPVPAGKVQAEAVEPHSSAPAMAPSTSQAQALSSMPLVLMPAAAPALQGREQVRQSLAQVRHWIEENEPSSPVAVLLKQAERMWGKRFSEVAHMIPPELLQAWDQGE